MSFRRQVRKVRLIPLMGLVSLLLSYHAPTVVLAGDTRASGPPSAPAPALIIGMLLPPEEAQAQSLREGVLLATTQAKATVLIRGRAGQWGADGVEAAAMVSDDEVMGLIAPPNGAGSHLALQVAGRTAVPVISLCADSSVTEAGVPWMTRAVPSTVEEARILLKCSPSHPSAGERWAAVVPAGRSGREASRDLLSAATATGCSLQTPVTMPDSPTAQAELPKQLLSGGATSVLVWLDPAPAGKLVKALQGAGFRGTLAGPGWLDCRGFLDAAAASVEGFIIPAIVRQQENEERFRTFSASYRTRFGYKPDAMALYSYDAANLLLELLSRFGSAALRRGTPPGFELAGASGMLRFDSLGNRSVTLRLLIADQGHFVRFREHDAGQAGFLNSENAAWLVPAKGAFSKITRDVP